MLIEKMNPYFIIFIDAKTFLGNLLYIGEFILRYLYQDNTIQAIQFTLAFTCGGVSLKTNLQLIKRYSPQGYAEVSCLTSIYCQMLAK